MKWQFYPKPRFNLRKTQVDYQNYAWFDYVLCVGFLQFNWQGKPWVTHLRCSPEYTEKVKEASFRRHYDIVFDEHRCLEFSSETGRHQFYLQPNEIEDLYNQLHDYYND